ncbi:MAG: peptide chain release factor N(5)-glutamine methyltransferase [Thermodesulfobacteriota bacterium]
MSSQAPLQPTDWNIQRVLEWTTNYFKSHRIDSPRTTAEVLLAHALHLERIDLYLRYDQPLSRAERAVFKEFVRRRILHEPVAYITGSKEFWSMSFQVSPAVLIPRPDTECLVEAALELLPREAADGPGRVLELGTGSGAIIVALASERRGHRYFASEKSTAAAAQARENARAHGLTDQILFFCSDWFGAFRKGALPFDLIVSNPPYIAAEAIDGLEPEIAGFEPRLALDGDKDGLSALRQIIRSAPPWLRPGGHLLLEIGFDQRTAVAALAADCGAYGRTACFRDYGGRDRVMQLTRV